MKISENSIVLAVAVGLLMFGCNSQRLDSQWTATSITADGQTEDWEGLNRYIFDEEGVIIGVANDDANLYLLFRFSNSKLARSIAREGVTIWLNADGKKQETFGITYRNKFSPVLKPESDSPFPQSEGMNPNDPFRMMQETSLEQLVIHDIHHDFPVHVKTDGSSGPSCAFNQEDNFTYEFIVPLKAGSTEFAIGTHAGETILVGFKFGGMDQEQRKNMHDDRQNMGGPPGRGGGMEPGGGMGRGGGMGGKGPPGGRDSQKKNNKPTEIWLKSTLATSSSD